jgi:squalene synthase HpnC
VVQTNLSHPQDNREPGRSSNGESGVVDAAALLSAEKETRRLARSHYENFLVASVMLPRRLRQPFYNVYAFCRAADDLADESPSAEIAIVGLDSFQNQLDATFAGKPVQPLFIALASTIRQFDLPKQPFDDLLDAFRQDQRKTRYDSIDQLLDYCRRSANPVGRLVLRLGDTCDDQSVEMSDEICTGLQLANFWQDVARDYAIGRIYLPVDEMNRFHVTEGMLGESSTPQEMRQLLASECDRAESFFRRGLPLAKRVPRWLSHDVKLFAHGGLATLDAIRRIDFDVLRSRPTVSKWRQSALLARAMLGLL